MTMKNNRYSQSANANSLTLQNYLRTKRFLSLLIGIPLFFGFVPFGIVISLIIMLEDPSGGPPIFLQDRLGRGMKKFKCVKFRTMRRTAPRNQPTNCFVDADVHITRVGKFLRKTSLDEFPQLWNVVKGEMSLIGPRPLILCETDVHERRNQQGIYSIRPGITGLAQISGRDKVNDTNKVDLDYRYYTNLSFLLDAKIFFLTIVKIISMYDVVEGARDQFAHPDCCTKEEIHVPLPEVLVPKPLDYSMLISTNEPLSQETLKGRGNK